MLTVDLFVIEKKGKQFQCLSIVRWVKKQILYIDTMGYDSATERNELLIHATIWMNLKIIMLLSERSQMLSPHQRKVYVM